MPRYDLVQFDREEYAARRKFVLACKITGCCTVFALIAVWIILASFVFLEYSHDSRLGSARMQIKSLKATLELYRLEHGEYPGTSDGIEILASTPNPPTKRQGPYCDEYVVGDDPWGSPLIYVSDGQTFTVRSLGPDGKFGTQDDIVAEGP